MDSELARTYDSSFFDGISDDSRKSAQVVVPLVRDLIQPMSVLDVGCGTGSWLAEWISLGITDVTGLDGDYVDSARLQIPHERFIPADLKQPFCLGRQFDLVECLEVAEHLDAAYADRFVESLAGHGDVILFSAAIPFQGGTHHVNEQWPSYWVRRFAAFGFRPYDIIRPQIWNNKEVRVWYRQNAIIFSRGLAFDTTPAGITGSAFDVVHPEIWHNSNTYEPFPREVLLSLPSALSVLFKCKFYDIRRKLGMPVGPAPGRAVQVAGRRSGGSRPGRG